MIAFEIVKYPVSILHRYLASFLFAVDMAHCLGDTLSPSIQLCIGHETGYSVCLPHIVPCPVSLLS